MKLAGHQDDPPPGHGLAQALLEPAGEDQHAAGIEEAQDGSHDELGVTEPEQGEQGLADSGEEHGADEGPGHGAGKGEVVVGGGEATGDIMSGRAVD